MITLNWFVFALLAGFAGAGLVSLGAFFYWMIQTGNGSIYNERRH